MAPILGQPAREFEDAGADRLERLQRGFQQELASSTSLNLRGATLGGFSVVALLLAAQFAATWLDDAKWDLGDLSWLLEVCFYVAVGAFALCVLVSIAAIAPRGIWRGEHRNRVEQAITGTADGEAAELGKMLEKQRARNEQKSLLILAASILMVIGILAVTVQALAFAVKADVSDLRPAASVAAVPPPPVAVALSEEEQKTLVRKYAPVVRLHPRDGYMPMDPDDFLEGSALQWRTRRGRIKEVVKRGEVSPARLGRRCLERVCETYKGWLAAELTRPFSGGPRAALLPRPRGFALDAANSQLRGTGTDAPFLYEVGQRASRNEMRVTYWFFYGYSVPFVPNGDKNLGLFSHEGDWENIDVVLGLDDKRPRRVEFHGHGGPPKMPDWDEAERTGSGRTHPVVYAARDSHASYPTVGPPEKLCRVGYFCSKDVRAEGLRWAPWEQSELGLRDARTQEWYGFGGAWGRAKSTGGGTGPLGPSKWKLAND